MYNAQDFAQILYFAGEVHIINKNNVFRYFFQTGRSHHWNNSPLGHIILILSQPVFALSPAVCLAVKQHIPISYEIIFGLTRLGLESTIYRTLTITPSSVYMSVRMYVYTMTWFKCAFVYLHNQWQPAKYSKLPFLYLSTHHPWNTVMSGLSIRDGTKYLYSPKNGLWYLLIWKSVV